MQEHRYRSRDKTVKKMSREGLTEENLRSHKSVRISSKELDSLQLSGQPEDQIDTQKLCMDEAKATKRRLVSGRNLAGRDTVEETEVISGRSMEQSPLRIDKGSKAKEEPDKDKPHGHKHRGAKEYKKEFYTILDGMADDCQDKWKRFTEEQGDQADEDIDEETGISARVNEHSIRADNVRKVSSGKQEYVEAAAKINHNRKKKQVQAHAKQLKERNKDTTAKKYKKEFSTVPDSMADDGKDKWKRFTKEPGDQADEDVPKETSASARMNEHSLRTESIRRTSYEKHEHMEDAEELSHKRKKKQVQAYANQQKKKTDEYQKQDTIAKNENRRFWDNQESADHSLEVFSDEIKGKARREQIHKEQRKSVSRLSFEDEGGGMVRGPDMGIVKKTASMATGAVSVYLHGKGHEVEQDNAAIEASHRAELAAEDVLRYAMARSGRRMHQKPPRLLESSSRQVWKGRKHLETVQESGKIAGKYAAEFEQGKKREIRRFWQKQRYKKMYQAARNGEQASQAAIQVSQTIIVKAKKAAAAVVRRSSGFLGAAVTMVMLFALAATSLSSCSAFLQGGTTTVVGTTYPSTDEDIYTVENAYKALENALNEQINSMESRHPDYDDYRYQVDEISHNPYHLISYFTAKYGEFTYRQVADEVEEIFRQQYGISTENTRATVTETRTVRVGESLGQVVTSGYCSCPICCGVWSGGPTASGVYPTANHTIAVDASNPFVPMGTRVVMNGVEYVVEDTGGFAQYGVQFDVYYGDHAAASAHGHQTWEAYIADSNGSQEVEVTSTHEVNRLDVSLTNHNLDAVLRSRMDENEEKRYDIYNTTLGNRDYLFDNLPSYGSGGFGYDIPAEALSDRKFANMIREAEKYLGYPYVWGGASPSTSFDCSGFVSWVINNCGNGWNVGRQTADGLRGCCSYVSPSEAKPGDLIFFQGTYSTPGASHVGIYVGNNMMIHCGNPIQYTSISSSYWQEHFMAFGRIH